MKAYVHEGEPVTEQSYYRPGLQQMRTYLLVHGGYKPNDSRRSQNKTWGAEDMATLLRAFDALAKDPGSVSNTYMMDHNQP